MLQLWQPRRRLWSDSFPHASAEHRLGQHEPATAYCGRPWWCARPSPGEPRWWGKPTSGISQRNRMSGSSYVLSGRYLTVRRVPTLWRIPFVAVARCDVALRGRRDWVGLGDGPLTPIGSRPRHCWIQARLNRTGRTSVAVDVGHAPVPIGPIVTNSLMPDSERAVNILTRSALRVSAPRDDGLDLVPYRASYPALHG